MPIPVMSNAKASLEIIEESSGSVSGPFVTSFWGRGGPPTSFGPHHGGSCAPAPSGLASTGLGEPAVRAKAQSPGRKGSLRKAEPSDRSVCRGGSDRSVFPAVARDAEEGLDSRG